MIEINVKWSIQILLSSGTFLRAVQEKLSTTKNVREKCLIGHAGVECSRN